MEGSGFLPSRQLTCEVLDIMGQDVGGPSYVRGIYESETRIRCVMPSRYRSHWEESGWGLKAPASPLPSSSIGTSYPCFQVALRVSNDGSIENILSHHLKCSP